MAPTQKDKKAAASERPADSVASPAENDKLKHSTDPEGTTTRSDLLDAGVPMAQGDGTEPVGPEDALGVESTRGDYTDRIDSGPHLASVPVPADEREDVELKDDDDNVIGHEPGPRAKLVEQVPSTN